MRRGDASPLAGLRQRLEADPDRLRLGPMAVLHAIVDSVVDTYTVIDEEIASDLEAIETEVFSGSRMDSATIYRLKREVLEFRRAAVPLSAPLQMLHHSTHSPVDETELRLLLRDVSDHLQAVIDHVESYDRLLTDILGAHLAQISVQQNSDMRRISAWVAIAAVPTMIAGIYGMNFDDMPELALALRVLRGARPHGRAVPRHLPRLQAQRVALGDERSPPAAGVDDRHPGVTWPRSTRPRAPLRRRDRGRPGTR